VSFAAPFQSRLVLILVAVIAGAIAALMVMRMTVMKSDSSSSTAPPVVIHHAATPTQTTKTPAKPAKPVVVLNPGLPTALDHALRRSRVVVVALWAPRGSDRDALAEARAGAKASHAGFAAINVLDEKQAVAVNKLVGTVSDPAVIVVKRPGTVETQFDGFADRAMVSQAAHNAGAR